ncbi:MAG: NTP transferase domain-containing protein [Spirochaetaceae bacterium]|nr:NTP transferase domain-containing protein [Spirochaetaceae bacterium]
MRGKSILKKIPDCIIPAAGRSRRMGSWKAALPWGEMTVLEKVTSEAVAAGCRTFVVGGYRHGELKRILTGREGLVILRNPSWRFGMDTTIKTALPSVTTDWFFVVPVDMPLVGQDDYKKLTAAALANPDMEVVRPSFEGRAGHPVLIRRTLVPALLRAPRGVQLKHSLEGRRVLSIDWHHDGVIRDLDTPIDYEQIKAGVGGP